MAYDQFSMFPKVRQKEIRAGNLQFTEWNQWHYFHFRTEEAENSSNGDVLEIQLLRVWGRPACFLQFSLEQPFKVCCGSTVTGSKIYFVRTSGKRNTSWRLTHRMTSKAQCVALQPAEKRLKASFSLWAFNENFVKVRNISQVNVKLFKKSFSSNL